MLTTPSPGMPATEAPPMTDAASKFMTRLDAAGGEQHILLHQLTVDWPAEVPTCPPSDLLWQTWWMRVVGPAPVAILGHLFHLVGNGNRTVQLGDVAQWVTPPEDPIEHHRYPLMRIQWAITRCALHRLVGFAPLVNDPDNPPAGDTPAWVLIFPNLVPRPGPAGYEAIGASLEALGARR